MRHPILAIDGGAGTGKTTSACEVARRLGFSYIDSGAIYRAVAYAARAAGIDGPDDPRLPAFLASLPLRAEMGPSRFRVLLDGEELSQQLRDPAVTSLASQLAVRSDVRESVGRWLRSLAEQGPAVVEGRDIGTAVFPNADLKIFLTATLPVRAERRAKDLEAIGRSTPVEEVARQLAERDKRDAEREIAPLRRAPDAVVVDTTATDIEGQVRQILDAWGERMVRSRGLYRFAQITIGPISRALWSARAAGAENVPKAGGVLLASNHKSYLDPPLVGTYLPRPIHYLAKRQLFSIPFFGPLIRRVHAIPIDREGFDRSSIEQALAILRGGGALLVFPEGTRIRRPGLGEPKEGIAWLAARAEVPIVPVRIRGSWPVERKANRGISIRYGQPFRLPPVAPGKAGRERFPEMAARILREIEALEPVPSGD
ncbi:MAG: (d)CMP kinase [Candidatus Eisenbacteria bacterium]|nr:(d)CMP kinase [Candidatus Eisenbacteria bacterium]